MQTDTIELQVFTLAYAKSATVMVMRLRVISTPGLALAVRVHALVKRVTNVVADIPKPQARTASEKLKLNVKQTK